MMVVWDEEVSCQVVMMDEWLLMVKSGDGSVREGWKERVLLQFLWGLWTCYTWLQRDNYCKMGSRNGKLDQHNECG